MTLHVRQAEPTGFGHSFGHIPPIIWRRDELAGAVAALPMAEPPTDKRARRIAREQRQRSVEQQVATLRGEGRTWAEVAAATGLAASRVRAIHARHVGASERPDDDAILENLRQFLTECGKTANRRAYAAWPGRMVSPATIESRFGSWTIATKSVQAKMVSQ